MRFNDLLHLIATLALRLDRGDPLGRRMGDLRRPVSTQPRCRIPVRFPIPQTNFSPYIPLSGGCPGIEASQVATTSEAVLGAMERSKVLTARGGGQYLDASGRGLLAASQRVSTKRAYKRHGIYTKKGGEYRNSQRLHNQTLAETVNELRRQGVEAWTSPGFVIDCWDRGQVVRVVPDGFVLLPPGVLVALEYEQSAKAPSDVGDKANKYRRLTAIGRTLPVLFVTETQDAAEQFCQLGQSYLLATTLERLARPPGTDGDRCGIGLLGILAGGHGCPHLPDPHRPVGPGVCSARREPSLEGAAQQPRSVDVVGVIPRAQGAAADWLPTRNISWESIFTLHFKAILGRSGPQNG